MTSRTGKRVIIVRNDRDIEREYHVPDGKHLRVHGGDRVQAGDPLFDGPLVPHDILRDLRPGGRRALPPGRDPERVSLARTRN